VFCIYLRTNSDLCHLHNKLIGFCNRDEKCLLRGTDWAFKYSGLRFVCKGLKAAVTANKGWLDFDKTVNCIIWWASEGSVQLHDHARRDVTNLLLCRLGHCCTQRKTKF
jgi:hypothetical protein